MWPACPPARSLGSLWRAPPLANPPDSGYIRSVNAEGAFSFQAIHANLPRVPAKLVCLRMRRLCNERPCQHSLFYAILSALISEIAQISAQTKRANERTYRTEPANSGDPATNSENIGEGRHYYYYHHHHIPLSTTSSSSLSFKIYYHHYHLESF